MKSLVNAVLSYGLLNVQVGVCTANKRNEVKFRRIHKDCGIPISEQHVCLEHGVLEPEDIVPALPIDKQTFIPIDPAEYEKVKGGRTNVIEVKKFVSWDDVDDLQMEKQYFLKPGQVVTRAYTLLSAAMQATNTVGIGTARLWGKETPIMVWARDNGTLLLSQAFCHDEIIDDAEIQKLIGEVPDEEMELAEQLVVAMTRELDPETDLVSNQQQQIQAYLESVVSNVEPVIPEHPVAPEVTFDIQEKLKASLEAARKKAA